MIPLMDFHLQSKSGEAWWLDAHNRQHLLYAKHFKIQGVPLEGPVNGDWMLRHVAQHVKLATHVKRPLSNTDSAALALPDKWNTDQELGDWLALHDPLHAFINRVMYGR